MSEKKPTQFDRFKLIVGKDGFDTLNKLNVIIFGIGGVGSWTAESLVRSGVGHLTIVDSDEICITNTNRQIHATTETIGQSKVQVLRDRLLTINPEATIETSELHYDRTTADSFDLDKYDYVIDAIDTLSSKIELIINTSNSKATLFSSLGSARKLDPTRIKIGDIWSTIGCRFGVFVRKRLRKRLNNAKFICVYSDELMPLQDESEDYETPPNGSAVHITGIFGFYLCGLVIQDAMKPFKKVRPLS